MSEIEERLNELELRFMEQARQIEDLNAVVAEDGRRLARLDRENSRLREVVGRLAPEMIESPDE
ncbi:MAG: SlyX family protein [Desulfuromonadales bacterium]|nr:SlyX family protein [Desulfuromonadales bacterium]NIS42881.1 SlyX family protein [Desulfuromonadales bacterium]